VQKVPKVVSNLDLPTLAAAAFGQYGEIQALRPSARCVTIASTTRRSVHLDSARYLPNIFAAETGVSGTSVCGIIVMMPVVGTNS
jgi:hypothetical protein